jgi:hypothetical protein
MYMLLISESSTGISDHYITYTAHGPKYKSSRHAGTCPPVHAPRSLHAFLFIFISCNSEII